MAKETRRGIEMELKIDVNVKIKEKVIDGIKVVHVKNQSLMAHVAFHSLSGSYAEGKKNQGVAHYLEHVFFKGTKNRTNKAIVNEAALMGATQNAYTSEFDTCYFLDLPCMYIDNGVELLCDQMFNPNFLKEEIDKERSVIQEERKMYEDNPMASFYEGLEKHLFNFQLGHPIIGTEKTINSIDRDMLFKYYKKHYGLNNIVLVVSSPFKHKEVFKMCAKHLKGNPFKIINEVEIEKKVVKHFIDTNVSRSNIQQTHMALLFKGLSLDHEDQTVHGCMMGALGSGMYSMLFNRIREDLGLCYRVSASYFTKTPYTGLDFIHTILAPENVEVAKSEIMSILDNLCESGIDEMAYRCSKAQMLSKICRMMSDQELLSSPVAKSFLWGYNFNIKKRFDEINDLTFEKVNSYTKKYMSNILYGKKKKYCWFTMSPEK